MVLESIDYCEAIIETIEGVTFEQFMQDKVVRAAIERWLSILGEASKRFSDDFRGDNQQIPWSKVRSMRNYLVHEYHRVDFAATYTAATEHVPVLLEELRMLV